MIDSKLQVDKFQPGSHYHFLFDINILISNVFIQSTWFCFKILLLSAAHFKRTSNDPVNEWQQWKLNPNRSWVNTSFSALDSIKEFDQVSARMWSILKEE